jgi:trigger factor
VKVTLEKQEKNLVHLAVEVPQDAVERAWEKAYRHLSQHVMIPGFRKGKAPRALVERHVGSDAMRREALDVIVPDAYNKAVEEVRLEPIAQPQVVDVTFDKGQPAFIKYSVEVRPEVKLGDYLNIKVAAEKTVVADDEVKKAIDQALTRKATVQTVDRAIQDNDVAILDFEGKLDGVPFDGGKATNFTLEVAPGRFIPGFTEALVGLKAGDTKTAELDFPADYANAELAGKKTTFEFKIHEVKERRLPELTDELAKEFGGESADDLRSKVKDQLQEQADEQREVELRKQLLDKIVETSEMELSEFMVKREIYFLLEQHFNQVARQGIDVKQLFNEENRADWEKRFEPEASKRIRTSLTLGAIARNEGIEVTAEEMGEAIVEYAQMLGKEPQAFQQELLNNNRYAALADEVLSNKIIEWLYERADVEGREKKAEEAQKEETKS